MSRWNPNFVPSNQGYRMYNQAVYTDPQLYSQNMFNPYTDNGNRFYAPQFAQNYGQAVPVNFYNVPNVESQCFNNSNNDNAQGSQVDATTPSSSNQTVSHAQIKTSTLTPTAEEFKPRNMSHNNSQDAANNGTIKRQQYYKNNTQNCCGNEQNKDNWYSGSYSRSSGSYSRESGNKYQDRNDYSQNFNKQKRRSYVNKNSDKMTEQNFLPQSTFPHVINDIKNSKSNKQEDPEVDYEKSDDVFKAKNSDKIFDRHRKKESIQNWNNGKSDHNNGKKGGRNENYRYDKRYEEVSDKAVLRERQNWRRGLNVQTRHWEEKKHVYPWELKKKLDAASQRERLEQMVERRLLECLVCCERLRHNDSVWSCKQCFHILHLNCVIRWARTSKLEAGWRCPACQNVYSTVPNDYRCYCDKVLNPRLEHGTLPHSCGEVCKRKGRSCEHTCTLLCHPGPCPDCTVLVPRSCGCGATKPTVKCSSEVPVVCQKICGKLLECGLHVCANTCHMGKCGSCKEFLRQECYCVKVGRKVPCSTAENGRLQYECGEVCGKRLACGNHCCEKLCHPGDCAPCAMSPAEVTACPCGKTKLKDERKSCLDLVPCCDKVCRKSLKCGQPSTPHQCQKPCHRGDCPPCPLTTLVRCRCGHMDKEIACAELTTKADDARCQKKCTKLRLCCKHKCNQMCCIEVEHVCPLPCNRMLSCGLHRCEQTCHRALCSTCWHTSFQELYCECGSSVLYPPVACGTRPPRCNKPCCRQRACGHEVYHNCHTGPCPPCTVLSKKWCHGRHEQRGTIPCHQKDFSCGLPCGKEMSCGRHKCIQPCHSGPCPTPCNQPCVSLRQTCEHTCNQPCHAPPCPETPCKQTVQVTCQCGLRSSTRACMELVGEYQSITMSHLASKMADIQKGQAVDISDIVCGQKRQGTLKTLECNEECRIVERNRRLAIGLQIRNPDLSAKLTPRYSDFMKNWAKKDTRFCQHIHDKLTELVQLAKQSKQKSRSYSFETMNKDKRHLVHEYCEHFGCDSEAYDAEPNRNIVATAFKEKSWLPSISLLEFLQRENGQRKVPGPIVGKKLSARLARPPTPPREYIDYFNDPPS